MASSAVRFEGRVPEPEKAACSRASTCSSFPRWASRASASRRERRWPTACPFSPAAAAPSPRPSRTASVAPTSSRAMPRPSRAGSSDCASGPRSWPNGPRRLPAVKTMDAHAEEIEAVYAQVHGRAERALSRLTRALATAMRVCARRAWRRPRPGPRSVRRRSARSTLRASARARRSLPVAGTEHPGHTAFAAVRRSAHPVPGPAAPRGEGAPGGASLPDRPRVPVGGHSRRSSRPARPARLDPRSDRAHRRGLRGGRPPRDEARRRQRASRRRRRRPAPGEPAAVARAGPDARSLGARLRAVLPPPSSRGAALRALLRLLP